jgi:hypothetical protein
MNSPVAALLPAEVNSPVAALLPARTDLRSGADVAIGCGYDRDRG